MEDCTPHVYCRNEIKFKDFERFKLFSKTFDRQYSDIYRARFEALREDITQKAKAKWAQYKVLKLSELAEKTDEELCIVIGTLYKHQELKPSILRELSEELQIAPQPARSNYASFKDMVYIEDETLRVKLVGKHVNTQDIVTGLVCAILGCELENGVRLVFSRMLRKAIYICSAFKTRRKDFINLWFGFNK
ncbi:hypothetical protein KM043_017127 [Ampulex compressa]|nr:hypothetical protein KM043_017127 [Ampulex compressa]